MSDDTMFIGAKVKLYHGLLLQYLEDNNMPVTRLAELSGISAPTLYTYTGLRHRVSEVNAIKLEAVTGIPAEKLRSVVLPAEIARKMTHITEIPKEALLTYAEQTKQRMLDYSSNPSDRLAESYDEEELMDKLNNFAKHVLTFREYEILGCYYGILKHEKKKTSELAEAFGVCRGRISQQRLKAESKLVEHLASFSRIAIADGKEYWFSQESIDGLANFFSGRS